MYLKYNHKERERPQNTMEQIILFVSMLTIVTG